MIFIHFAIIALKVLLQKPPRDEVFALSGLAVQAMGITRFTLT